MTASMWKELCHSTPIGVTCDWGLPAGGAQPAPAPDAPPSPPTPLDTDGDGIPDAAELLAGTNPLDPASKPGISSLQPAADGMHLQFPTVPGKTYRVEYSEDLTQNRWQTLLDHIPGTGTTRTVIDPLGTTLPKCFYRVVITAP